MKNRPRSANIELLRIVAMFIIVIHHISYSIHARLSERSGIIYSS